MTETAPVEVTTRYATTVPELTDAWQFVMDHIDRLGPDPTVTINPTWIIELGQDDYGPRRFSVVVSGTVNQ